MSTPSFNLVIVGVGGQGTLLASKILGKLAVDAGLTVKVSEVHGMSQRGGSVITHVRVGETVNAPLVALGEADYLLSFEALEAARAKDYLRDGGVLIVNTQRISPMPVILGQASYPQNPLCIFRSQRVESVDALQLAVEAGSQKTLNLVLLGMLSMHLPFAEGAWKEAIAASVPKKTLPMNLAAFERGRACIQK